MTASFFNLENRIALVTGASRGIGAAIAKRMAKAGATVILNYRSGKAEAEAVLAEVRKDSPASIAIAFDVSDPKQINEGVTKILEKFERLDILVSNAGISKEALIPRATPEHFEEVLKVNLLGSMNMVQQVSRSMMKNRWGRIICMSSVVGEMGNKGQSAYAASKAGLFGFTKSVAKELGSRGVTCNAIAPGFIETEMTGELPEEVRALYLESIPMGRMATTEEVAAAAHYLASEEAGYLNGMTLDINGGLFMR